MRKTIVVDIPFEYWKDFKKLCVEENISMAKKVERYINEETNKYIVSQLKGKEKEPEREKEKEGEQNEFIPN